MIDADQRNHVLTTLRQYADSINLEKLIKQHGSPLLVLDIEKVRQQYANLQKLLPGVRHHYAMKALTHPAVIQTIRDMDGYLDVATQGEIDIALAAGFPIEHCIHTHPAKKPADIQSAIDAGLRRFVVDNVEELAKFKSHRSKVEIMIRLVHSDPQATVNLAYKFGADHQTTRQIIQSAVEQGIAIAGFCMHVGSQTHNIQAYTDAIKQTLRLIDEVEAKHGITIRVLDIGGGFPVEYLETAPSLEEVAAIINPLLEPLADRFEILSEPGRYIVAPAVLSVSSVVSATQRHGQRWYYIDQGVYSSYSNLLFESIIPHIFALKELQSKEPLHTEATTIAGPTCDSVDMVAKDYPLPELADSDILVSPMMGAYTAATTTTFNSIPRTSIVLVNE